MSVYAANCKTVALGPDERRRMEKEIKKLKEMLSIHLDLIQHQADQAASRETQVKALRRENDLLLQKVERMERRLSVPARSPGGLTSPPPPPPPAAVAMVDSATSPPAPPARSSQHTQTSGDERVDTPPPPPPPPPPPRRAGRGRGRRFPTAPPARPGPAGDGPAEITPSAESRRIQRKLYRKGDEPIRHRKCMLTEFEYYQYQPDEPEESDAEDITSGGRQTHIEIPSWTVRQLSPLPGADAAENLDDAVFGKRHLKHETDEKRRKRWDLQRLRERRAYEKLKQSYYRGRGRASRRGGGAESETDRPLTLRPPAAGAQYLQVSPQLPVCAFGSNLPVLANREFQLPWTPGKAPPAPGGRADSRGRR